MHEQNHQTIHEFYNAFANRDVETMLTYYHKNVIYDDVGFGIQKGKNAKAVWQFLMENGASIESSSVQEKITVDVFSEDVKVNSFSINADKGFNEAKYDLSFSKKGLKNGKN